MLVVLGLSKVGMCGLGGFRLRNSANICPLPNPTLANPPPKDGRLLNGVGGSARAGLMGAWQADTCSARHWTGCSAISTLAPA
jgi:hypothetical protein